MSSAVLIVQKATPETITQFHDQVSNELPTIKGKWAFTFRIYRNNIYSIPPEMVDAVQAPDTRYLHTLAPSYLGDSTIALINKQSVGVFSSAIREENDDSRTSLTVGDDHLHMGATTGLNDPFDMLLGSKLQSLWTQRQLIKGDGGQTYSLENGTLTIRTANVFLHGNFRGLLIQIETAEPCSEAEFAKIREKYAIPEGVFFCGVMDKERLDRYGDLCYQYSNILDF